MSHGAIRYALIHFLDYSYNIVKSAKCQSAPDRVKVIRTFLKDYAEAHAEEAKADPNSDSKFSDCILVYTDESYIHQARLPFHSILPSIHRGYLLL